MNCSRRSLLRAIGGSAALTASAGCISTGPADGFELISRRVPNGSLGREFLRPNPLEIRADTRIDFDRETKESYLETLFDDGSVTARQWPLAPIEEWGRDERPLPAFLLHEGTYYDVRVTDRRTVEEERHLFAVERPDEDPPEDGSILREPFDSLSDRDREILQEALDAVHAGSDGFLGEPEFDELQPVQYHQDMSAEESDLVPDPGFDYVEYVDDYYRVITEQREVSIPERTFSIETIGDSESTLEEYALEVVPDARFESVSGDVEEILDEVTSEEDRRDYNEDPPPSDGLSTILEELGIASDLEPYDSYDERVNFRGTVGSYEGDWYVFDLLVFT